MPKEFKTLASITVWILFGAGCIWVFMATLNWVVNIGLFGPIDPGTYVGWGLGYATLFLSVVAAKLRQMLE